VVYEYNTIRVESAEFITTLTLNRPEKRNAMNPQMHREMGDALLKLEADPQCKVLVVTGAGGCFSSGMDLKEYFHDVPDPSPVRDANRRLANDWADRLLRMFPKPTIAMVEGWCLGGAFTIVCSCDIAFAAEDATFALTEVNWGGSPAGMVSKVLGSLVAYRDALWYALTAEHFNGVRAAEIKFVNKAFAAGQLQSETYALAAKLAALDGPALRTTKEAFKQVVDMSYEQAYWWLMAKSNELKWRHANAGGGGDGITKFVSKEYKPGEVSFTDTPETQTET